MIVDQVPDDHCVAKSVQANSDASAVVPEDVVVPDTGDVGVSKIDSPAPVGEDFVVLNHNVPDILQAKSYLIVVKVTAFDEQICCVVISTCVVAVDAFIFIVVYSAANNIHICRIHPSKNQVRVCS